MSGPASHDLVPIRDSADLEALDSLVTQVRAGDELAFTHIVRHLQARVHRWALAFAADADEADDVVQETFVLALRHMAQYRGGGALPVWLYQITRRAAGRLRRTHRRRTQLLAGKHAMPDRIVYETDPGARVDRAQLAKLVRSYWSELPERQRAVMDLVDLQGYSPSEAGDMLQLNQSTLRANLFKARQSVRARVLQHHAGRLGASASS